MPTKGTKSESSRRRDTLASLRTAFDILVRIQHGADWTASKLAGELGVTDRQIRRYLAVLEEFGVDFEGDENGNRRSPLRIVSASVHPPFNTLFLTQDELLLLYAMLAGVHHAGADETRSRLWEKVNHNLGVSPIDSERVAKALGAFDKQFKSYDKHREIIGNILKALHGSWTCQVTYRTPDGKKPSPYLIEPYELTEYDGGIYLYCRVPHHDNVIVLAVERIAELTVTLDQFRRSASVEETIAEKKVRAFGIFDDEQPLHVKLKFTPAVAFYVLEREWHPTQVIKRNRDGGLTLKFTATGRIEIERWIRGWGEECEVVSLEHAQ